VKAKLGGNGDGERGRVFKKGGERAGERVWERDWPK